MKKVISLLLTFAIILCTLAVPAMAADVATVTAKADYKANVINVEYNNTANYNCYVTIYMVDAQDCDDEVFTDYDSVDIIRMSTVEADAKSMVKVQFKFGADIKTGSYNFYAAPSGKNGSNYYAKVAQPVYIFGQTADEGDETHQDVLEFINAGSEADISSRAYQKLSLALGISDPAWRNAYLYAIKQTDFNGNFGSLTDVEEGIKIADAIYTIRSSSDDVETAIENGSEVLGMDIQNADYKNEKYHNSIVTLYKNKIQSADAKTKLKNLELFNQSIALTVINKGTPDDKARALSTYKSALGISDALFELINSENVGTSVVARHFGDFTTDDTAKLVEKITQILADIGKEPSKEQTFPSKQDGNKGGSVGGGITLPNQNAATFTDVPANHWANIPVEYLANMGVIAGKGNGRFDPDSTVTREEFVKMIVSAFKYTNSGSDIQFTDVPASHWGHSYIKIAFENNIVKGLSETRFGVGSPITRQDMAVIIMRVVNDKQIELSGNASSFADDAKIASYAKQSVMELVAGGIINGYSDGKFRPEGPLTRAEAAKVIYALVSR